MLQPKPTGSSDYRPQDLDDGDTSVARSEENFDPPPKPTGEQKAVAMTRVCLWRLREECRAIEDVTGKDSVPAYLRRCVKHLSIFERPIMSDQQPTGEWTQHDLREYHQQGGWKMVSDEINAAFAAEREKVQTLVAALKEIRGLLTLANRKIQIIDAALEKAMK